MFKKIIVTCFLSTVALLLHAQTQIPLKSDLMVGPIEGFTTAWHKMPAKITVPVGSTLSFRANRHQTGVIVWHGASQTGVSEAFSISERVFDEAGLHPITIQYLSGQPGGPNAETFVVEAIHIDADDIRVSPIIAETAPVVIDADDVNASSIRRFWEGSIASVTQVSEARFCTSIDRAVTLRVDLTPEALSSLVEWRIPGKPPVLGNAYTGVFKQGEHHIAAGPADRPQHATLDVYKAKITSNHRERDPSGDSELITLTAETFPPGFADHVQWMASTKFGTCAPAFGQGRSFSVRFENTFGPHPRTGEPFQWLGVRADNALYSQDVKEEDPLDGMVRAGNALSENVTESMMIAASRHGVEIDPQDIALAWDGGEPVAVATNLDASFSDQDLENGVLAGIVHLPFELEDGTPPGFYRTMTSISPDSNEGVAFLLDEDDVPVAQLEVARLATIDEPPRPNGVPEIVEAGENPRIAFSNFSNIEGLARRIVIKYKYYYTEESENSDGSYSYVGICVKVKVVIRGVSRN